MAAHEQHTTGRATRTPDLAVPTDGAAAHPEAIPDDLPRVRTGAVVVAGLVFAAALAGLFFLGWVPRQARLAALDSETSARDPRPTVDVAHPREAASRFDLRLPADVRPLQEASLFARANGYLRTLHADLGDHVKEGQLLAEIDAPEVDAALLQARAAEQQATANLEKSQSDLELTEATLQRIEGFASTGGVTKQQLDERRSAALAARSTLAAAKASLAAAQADVQRLTALQGFDRVVAPFEGTVTARNFDVGALLSPTSTDESAALFHLQRTDTLRVFVNVPQQWAGSLPTGQAAYLTLRTNPGREFAGEVTRTAGAVDPTTRTLRVEVDVPNADGAIYAGSFGEIRMEVVTPNAPLVVPTSAIVIDAAGTRVWVVEGSRVRSRDVALGLDFGTEIEVTKGLAADEGIVTNPGQRLADGAEVRVASKAEETKPAAAPASKPRTGAGS